MRKNYSLEYHFLLYQEHFSIHLMIDTYLSTRINDKNKFTIKWTFFIFCINVKKRNGLVIIKFHLIEFLHILMVKEVIHFDVSYIQYTLI